MTDDQIVAAWRFVRSCRPQKPERLCTYLVRIGGVRDDGGDVRALIGGSKSRPGLISRRGLRLDDAAATCWQQGYVCGPDGERPTISDLLGAIDRDLSTEGVYRQSDADAYAEWREYSLYYVTLDRLGLANLVSLAQVLRALANDRPREVPF